MAQNFLLYSVMKSDRHTIMDGSKLFYCLVNEGGQNASDHYCYYVINAFLLTSSKFTVYHSLWITVKLFSNGCTCPLSVKSIDVATSCDEHIPPNCTKILICRYLIAAMLPKLPISACQLSVNVNTNFHLYLQSITLGCVMQNGLWHF